MLDKYAHVFWLHLELVLTSTSVEHGGATLVAPKTMINGIIQELHPFFRCTPDLFRSYLYCVYKSHCIYTYIYINIHILICSKYMYTYTQHSAQQNPHATGLPRGDPSKLPKLSSWIATKARSRNYSIFLSDIFRISTR